MYSSSGADFEYITQRKRAGVSIHDAVYELACRNFPDEMADLEARVAMNNTRSAA